MAATPVIDLWNDITGNVLVTSLTNSVPFRLDSAKLFQNSRLSLRWHPIQPTGSISTPYLQVPVTGLSLDVGIGARAGAESILARQSTWAVNVAGGYLEATLDLNTVEMQAAFASADTVSSYFEIQMTESGNQRPVYQEQITIQSVVLGPAGASSLPSAANVYLTEAQIMARLLSYVRFIGNPAGATIELTSPTSGNTVTIGCRDNASFQADVI